MISLSLSITISPTPLFSSLSLSLPLSLSLSLSALYLFRSPSLSCPLACNQIIRQCLSFQELTTYFVETGRLRADSAPG